jgi:hypothetical protein
MLKISGNESLPVIARAALMSSFNVVVTKLGERRCLSALKPLRFCNRVFGPLSLTPHSPIISPYIPFIPQLILLAIIINSTLNSHPSTFH